jgi:predicted nucleotidyltransferase component of viral defense system
MTKKIKNISASVNERLRNIAIQSEKEINNLARQYVQERFLYRLSESEYANNFILKGALLFLAYNIDRSRPTRDIDFLGSSVSNNKDEIAKIVKQILQIDFEDGVRFDSDELESEDIVEDGDYHGVRIKFFAYIGNAKERVQIDICFGDKLTSGPVHIEFPTLLDFPAPKLNVYSVESAIAEKFEAIVSLQLQTSRMKDFYDILLFAGKYKFKKNSLNESLLATFKNRKAELSLRLKIYEDKFKKDLQLQKYWTAFLNRNNLTAETNFATVIDKIKSFIEPVITENKSNTWNFTDWKWQ